MMILGIFDGLGFKSALLLAVCVCVCGSVDGSVGSVRWVFFFFSFCCDAGFFFFYFYF